MDANRSIGVAQMKLFGVIESLKALPAVPRAAPKKGLGPSYPSYEEFSRHQEWTSKGLTLVVEALQVV
jgi:hypothetical protein